MTPLSEAIIFPTLLRHAFQTLNLATPEDRAEEGESPKLRVDRAICVLACGVEQLRNQQGTAHGSPWLPTITDATARIAMELSRAIAECLLARHSEASGNG